MRVLLICSLFLLGSCGKNLPIFGEEVQQQSVKPAKSEPYGYELGNRNCTTGEQSFSTFEETCKALLDDELNNNCVPEKRLELFESAECPA